MQNSLGLSSLHFVMFIQHKICQNLIHNSPVNIMCVLLRAGPHEGAIAASAQGAAQVSAVPFLRLRRTDDNEGPRRTQGPGERSRSSEIII